MQFRSIAFPSLTLAGLLATAVLQGGQDSSTPGQCVIHHALPQNALLTSTGNEALDNNFRTEGKRLSTTFRVTPNLFLFNGATAPNAYASSENTRSGYRGTVYFGVMLLGQELYSLEKGGVAVAGILAHEFAHIAQMENRFPHGGKYLELHADLLAGCYLGKKNTIRPLNVEGFANSLYEKGDYAFWDPSHHGTPEERVNALLTGFASVDLSFNEIYEQGGRFLVSNGLSRSQLSEAILRQTESFFGASFEGISESEYRLVVDNVRELASTYLEPERRLLGLHLDDVWSAGRADAGHVERCPICYRSAAAVARGTRLASELPR